MFKMFYLNALSVIVTFEKKLKSLIMHQVVSFNKLQKVDINEIYTEKIKALQDLAVLICEAQDSEGQIKSAAEFSVYMMKFSHRPEIESALKFIEKKISNLLEFNLQFLTSNEKTCVFTPMIMMFKEKQLLTGPSLHQAIEKVHQGIEKGR